MDKFLIWYEFHEMILFLYNSSEQNPKCYKKMCNSNIRILHQIASTIIFKQPHIEQSPKMRETVPDIT